MPITTKFRECFRADVFGNALDEVQDTFRDHLDTISAAKAAFEAAVDQVQVVDVGGGPVSISFQEALDQLEGSLDALLTSGSEQGAPDAADFRRNIGVVDGGDLERRLGANGIHLLNGVGIIENGVNLVAPRDAYRTLGSDFDAWLEAMLLADNSVFVTLYTDVTQSSLGIDDCGSPVQVLTDLRVYGTRNQSAAQFAALHGVEITTVSASVYWIGSVQTSFAVVTLLRNVGFSDEQIGAILSEASFPDNDGKLPTVSVYPGTVPAARTSTIIESGRLVNLRTYFTDAEIKTLMDREFPLGLMEVPIGSAWFDQLGAVLSRPGVAVNGVRVQDGQDKAPTTDEDPLLAPTSAAVGLINPAKTIAWNENPGENECFSLAAELGFDEVVAFVLGIFDSVLKSIQGAASAMAGAATSLMLKLNTKIQEMMESLGYGSVLVSSILCFLGAAGISLGSGFADGIIAGITTAVDLVIATITAPLDALNVMFAAMSIPMCFSLAMLKDLLGPASGCIPAKFEIPEDLLTCLQIELDKILKSLTGMTGMVDAIGEEIKGLLAFVKHALNSILLGFAGEKAACFSPAAATTLAAVSIGFR